MLETFLHKSINVEKVPSLSCVISLNRCNLRDSRGIADVQLFSQCLRRHKTYYYFQEITDRVCWDQNLGTPHI